MKQNKYDDPEFFAGYSSMARSVEGLVAAGEWHEFRRLLPDFLGKRVFDLGCGFGWHCRYVWEQGASYVLGVDLSEKMLERARELSPDSTIQYRRAAIEDLRFEPGEFDVVLSSLAFHYVQRFDLVCAQVRHCLTPGGAFVFSVEHPIFTAREAQDWIYGDNGERLHWPVDTYQQEGLRRTNWLVENVVKYHRTFSTYLNTLIENGFEICQVVEPEPSVEMLDLHPEAADESRRPMFLLISARKSS